MFKLSAISKLCSCVYLCTYVGAFTPLISNAVNAEEKLTATVKTNVHEKYYQQALYYYFQGDYAAALNIISESQLRLNALDQSSQLFAAGLQVNLGLQEQAKQTLIALNRGQQEAQAKSSELYVLALLSLAEQFIAQDEVMQAQQSLAKITQITPSYYQQYQVLSQLAYWPQQPDLLPVSIPNTHDDKMSNTDDSSPYIELNNALRFMETGEFIPAIDLLTMIKNKQWQAPEQTFWQLLFSADQTVEQGKKAQAQLQSQAVNDYATLLLAQLYVQQAAYDKAFVELKTFPQQSPYTESALFLFAFSAQQIKQNTTALRLLTLLHQQYPYSHLGWQAGLLMAKQVTEQKGLTQGWQAYQEVEKFFLQQLEQLDDFEQSFATSTDLLSFSTTVVSIDKKTDHDFQPGLSGSLQLASKPYAPESIWLQQALNDASLTSLYQQLSELRALELHSHRLQQKSDWIAETIQLNIRRKARIAASQQAIAQQDVYSKLLAKRESLSAVLALALFDPQQNGFAFADEKEQVLLDRLHRSKKNLAYIIEHGDEIAQTNIAAYQQRLNRIDAVLIWQLKQQYPQRAWQHKQQLAALDQDLQKVAALQKRIARLSPKKSTEQSIDLLPEFTSRQKAKEAQITQLLEKLRQLKSKLSSTIRIKVAQYIDEQGALLNQHLLSTRRAMASVLEKMAESDEKIEKQLNLDELTVKEPVL